MMDSEAGKRRPWPER